MVRARHVFTVSYGRIGLIVRVLPTVRDVDASYRGGKRRRGGKWALGYFEPAPAGAAHTGTIVIALNGHLREHIPHEAAHVSKYALGGVINDSNEERHATAVGKLSAAIFNKLNDLGVEV